MAKKRILTGIGLSSFEEQMLQGRKLNDLSTDAQTLFGLLTLIVDIKYRVKYQQLDDPARQSYGVGVKTNEVLADQVSPVDDALLGT